MNLQELKELAENATPGPWFAGIPDEVHKGATWIDSVSAEDARENLYSAHIAVYRDNTENDAEYVAAANPQTVLELIETVESLLAVEPIEESWHDYSWGMEQNGWYCHFCGSHQGDDDSEKDKKNFVHAPDCPWFLAKERRSK